MPRSNVTPGSVRARANATPSNVLWLSFLTITSHGRSLPEPGPVERGFCFRTGGATVLMDSSVVVLLWQVPPTRMRGNGRDRGLPP